MESSREKETIAREYCNSFEKLLRFCIIPVAIFSPGRCIKRRVAKGYLYFLLLKIDIDNARTILVAPSKRNFVNNDREIFVV